MTSRRGTGTGVWQREHSRSGESHSPSSGLLSHHMACAGMEKYELSPGEGQTGQAKGGKTLWSARPGRWEMLATTVASGLTLTARDLPGPLGADWPFGDRLRL